MDTVTSINEHVNNVLSGAVNIEDYIKRQVSVIEEKNKTLNAFLEVFDDVGDQVKVLQDRITRKEDLPLAGVSVAVKDNILIKGKHATAASKILESFVAPYDATVISKLRDKGAIFLGRTNMDEFAMGSSTENSAFGATKNPHDTTRVPGGSSGGSAVSVAEGMTLASLGSETGGSIRQPASFCGVCGLKPTYGAVSRYGLMAMASSLDQIGPITKSVSSAETMFEHMSLYDARDATSVPNNLRTPKKSAKKICYPKKFLESGTDPDVFSNFIDVISKLEKDFGYTVDVINIPELSYALPTYYIIMPAEASSNLARYDGIRYGAYEKGEDVISGYVKTRERGFGKEVTRRIMLGTYVLSSGYYDAYYKRANVVRGALTRTFSRIFRDYDAVMTPTTPTPAFSIGEKSDDPLSMYTADILTVSANLSGMPALSVPKGSVEREGSSLPLGIQIMAPHFSESITFSIGRDVEKIDS